MYRIRIIVDHILSLHIYTSACVVGLSMATERIFLPACPGLFSVFHVFLFASGLFVYNLPYAWQFFRVGVLSKLHFRMFCVSLALLCFCVSALKPQVWGASLVCGILAACYSLPLLPFPAFRRFRDHGVVKIMVLSAVWTFATTYIPFVQFGVPLFAYPFEVAIRWSFITILCLLFDLRDVETDKKCGLLTVPVRLGLQKTSRFMLAMLTVYVGLAFAQYFNYHNGSRLLMNMVTAVLLGMILKYLTGKATPKAFNLLADGIMLVYALLILT